MPEESALHPPVAGPLGDVVTERLTLRRFRWDDLDDLTGVFAHPEVWRYPYGRGFTRDETAAFLKAQLKGWEARGFGLWAAIRRGDDQLIGFVGLSVPTFLAEMLPAVEVGWRLHPTAWGHGYATEGATAALDEAFTTLGLPEVCSIPEVNNLPSVRVAERLDMRLDRRIEIPANRRRGPLQGYLFRTTAKEWFSRS